MILIITENEARGKALWGFNNSLVINSDFPNKMQSYIKKIWQTIWLHGNIWNMKQNFFGWIVK